MKTKNFDLIKKVIKKFKEHTIKVKVVITSMCILFERVIRMYILYIELSK